EGQMRDLASILKETLLRLYLCLDDPAYNYMLLTTDFTENFHWHIEIAPRLTVDAGFELGTGIHVNTIAPEKAAAYLRAIDLTCAWSDAEGSAAGANQQPERSSSWPSARSDPRYGTWCASVLPSNCISLISSRAVALSTRASTTLKPFAILRSTGMQWNETTSLPVRS